MKQLPVIVEIPRWAWLPALGLGGLAYVAKAIPSPSTRLAIGVALFCASAVVISWRQTRRLERLAAEVDRLTRAARMVDLVRATTHAPCLRVGCAQCGPRRDAA